VQEQGPNNVFGTLSHKHQPVIPREFGWTCNVIFNKYNYLFKKISFPSEILSVIFFYTWSLKFQIDTVFLVEYSTRYPNGNVI
jgi:hypothetical protein